MWWMFLYAQFNADFGLCCNSNSIFYLETLFEHFACKYIVSEGWEFHSFSSKLHHDIDEMKRLLSECQKVLTKNKNILQQKEKVLLLEINHYLDKFNLVEIKIK